MANFCINLLAAVNQRVAGYLPSFNQVCVLSGKALEVAGKAGIVASVALGIGMVFQAPNMTDAAIGLVTAASGSAISATVLSVRAALSGKKVEAAGWLSLAMGTSGFSYKCNQLMASQKSQFEMALPLAVKKRCADMPRAVDDCPYKFFICKKDLVKAEARILDIDRIKMELNERQMVLSETRHWGVVSKTKYPHRLLALKEKIDSCQAALAKENDQISFVQQLHRWIISSFRTFNVMEGLTTEVKAIVHMEYSKKSS